MKNIPRIFVGDNVATGMCIPAPRDVAHYLTRVMRRRDCIAFGGGHEFSACLSDDNKSILIGDERRRTDPSNDITLYFAPIKRVDDLINMATQMGVRRLVPVITERTTAHHINWDRMRKIAIEAAEQSNRCSVPEISAPVRFAELDMHNMVFGDERAAYGAELPDAARGAKSVLIGPEGGFSDAEFDALRDGGAVGISLGRTILRAELAAAIAISRIIA